MALQALLIALADDRKRSHVSDALVCELQALGCEVPPAVVAAANWLDLFYLASRYPDALAGADPTKVFYAEDAALALGKARVVFSFAESSIARG